MTVVIAIPPGSEAPRVGVTITGLGASPSIITVESTWDGGRTWRPVRGAQRITVISATFVTDFVPALNVEITYRVVVHAGPAITGGDRAVVTVPSTSAWIQDPLDPRGAVPVSWVHGSDAVRLLSASGSSHTRGQAVDVVTPARARYPVASLGARLAPSGIPVHLRALVASQGALVNALLALIDLSGTVVLRGLPPELGLDPVAHIIAPDIQDSPVNSSGDLHYSRDWVMQVQQVRPTSMRIVVPWWSYADVKALWDATAPTYAWTGTASASTSTSTLAGTTRTNAHTNPAAAAGTIAGNTVPSFALYAPGTTGAGTTTRVAPATDGPVLPDGTRAGYVRHTVTTAKTTGVGGWQAVTATYRKALALVAGAPAAVALYARYVGAPIADTVLTAAVYTSGGVVAGQAAANVSMSTSEWQRVGVVAVSTGVGAAVGWSWQHAAGVIPPVGARLEVTAVLIEAATEVGDYLDGSMLSTLTYAGARARRPGLTYLDWLADPTPDGES